MVAGDDKYNLYSPSKKLPLILKSWTDHFYHCRHCIPHCYYESFSSNSFHLVHAYAGCGIIFFSQNCGM